MNISWMTLRDARQLRGWTQGQLADELGVHQKTVANWESKGVPPRQAYKVQRVLSDELKYAAHREMSGDPDLSFDDYKRLFLDPEDLSQGDKDRLEAEFAERAASFDLSPDEYADRLQSDSEYVLEQQQQAYDARLAVREALSAFSTDVILNEIKERFRDLSRDNS